MTNISRIIFSVALVLSINTSLGVLVDTDNNPVTNQTYLGDIDMGVSTYGSFMGNVVATNIIQDIMTNSVIVDYTGWTYSGDISPSASYSIMITEPNYTFALYDKNSSSSPISSVTTNIINPTSLSFAYTGGTIMASREPIWRNANGLAMYSDVARLETKIDTMDTSYFRTNIAIAAQTTTVVCPSNQNQTVQFINAPAEVNRIEITFPKEGMTKDWLVYIESMSEIELVLPPADYWVANETVTNSIPSNSLTALYFSQVSDNVFTIGRQKLLPVTIPSSRQLHFQAIRESNRRLFRKGIK